MSYTDSLRNILSLYPNTSCPLFCVRYRVFLFMHSPRPIFSEQKLTLALMKFQCKKKKKAFECEISHQNPDVLARLPVKMLQQPRSLILFLNGFHQPSHFQNN